MSLVSLLFRPGRSVVASLAPALLALVLLAGCATEPTPAPAADTTKYTLENTDRFVAIDRFAQQVVSCTGLQYRALADGRLEVIANLKNREGKRIDLQASCVFRDETGTIVLEETPWKTISLPERTTEAARFTATNLGARNYTVRVRQAR